MEETGEHDKRAEDGSETGSPQPEVLLESCCLPDETFWLDGQCMLSSHGSLGEFVNFIVASIKDVNNPERYGSASHAWSIASELVIASAFLGWKKIRQQIIHKFGPTVKTWSMCAC